MRDVAEPRHEGKGKTTYSAIAASRRATWRRTSGIFALLSSSAALPGSSGTAASMPYQIISGRYGSSASSARAASAAASGQRSAGASFCNAEA